MKSVDPRKPRLPSQRGPKRTGPIGTIQPGDDVEVARDIQRIWDRLLRLEIIARKVIGKPGDIPAVARDPSRPVVGDPTADHSFFADQGLEAGSKQQIMFEESSGGGAGVMADFPLIGGLHSWPYVDYIEADVFEVGGYDIKCSLQADLCNAAIQIRVYGRNDDGEAWTDIGIDFCFMSSPAKGPPPGGYTDMFSGVRYIRLTPVQAFRQIQLRPQYNSTGSAWGIRGGIMKTAFVPSSENLLLGHDEHIPNPGTQEEGTGIFWDDASESWVTSLIYDMHIADDAAITPSKIDPDGSEGDVMQIDGGVVTFGSAGGAAVGDHGVNIYRIATQAASDDSSTVVAWTHEYWDTDTYHDTVTDNGKIIIPADMDGKYQLFARVPFAANATGWRAIQIDVNGSDGLPRQYFSNLGGSIDTEVTIFGELDLNVADELEVVVRQNSGGSLNINPAGSVQVVPFFVLRKVS